MAKIAGRKNDGAWVRFNKWIIGQKSDTQAAFSNALVQSDSITAAYQVILIYIQDTGLPAGSFPTSVTEWATELSIGVPRQVWFGTTTYDEYKGNSSVGYTKLMQPAIFAFSVDVRDIAKRIRFSRQEIVGLAGLTRGGNNLAAHAKQPGEGAVAYAARRMTELRAYLVDHPLTPKSASSEPLTDVAEISKLGGRRARTSPPKGSPDTGKPT